MTENLRTSEKQMLSLDLDSSMCRHEALFNAKSARNVAHIIGDTVHGHIRSSLLVRRLSHGSDSEVTQDTFNRFPLCQVTSV